MDEVTLGEVVKIVSTSLPLCDACTLLRLNSFCRRLLESHSPLWKVLDLREKNKAGERLLAALSLERYRNVEEINLEFSRDIDDNHLIQLKALPLKNIQRVNLNCCQKITDTGVMAVAEACPNLKSFSIYWNVRISDSAIKHITERCSGMISLDLSGCKNITDKGLQAISNHCKELRSLNLTRCVQVTDVGLMQLLENCKNIEELNLYADSSFTNVSYMKISNLSQLKVLDLCGAQNLSDEGLSLIASCKQLVSLNLTWCVSVTDVGIKAIAQNCHFLEFLSLFGILGVTDSSIKALSKFLSEKLTTLDVNGCVNIKRRSKAELLNLFPKLICFKVHS